MREAAYTPLGRNALSAALVSHVSALIAGMMTVAGAQAFSCAAYGFGCLACVTGTYLELKDRGFAPLLNPAFYAAAALSVVPAAGPVAVLPLLYAVQGSRKGAPFTVGGMLASIPRLKLNPLVLFFFLTILFILFALSIVQRDPYFRKAGSVGARLEERPAGQACLVREPAAGTTGPQALLPGKGDVPLTELPI